MGRRLLIPNTPTMLLWTISIVLGISIGVLMTQAKEPPTADEQDSGDPITTGHVHHHGSGKGMSIAQHLGNQVAISFCVSSSLEPYDTSLAQVRSTGPEDAADRFQWCLTETVMDHPDDAMIAELENHQSHFESCYSRLQAGIILEKPQAVDQITECVGRDD